MTTSPAPIAEGVAKLTAGSPAGPPIAAYLHEAAAAATENVGRPFPGGELRDAVGRQTTFARAVAGRPAVVIFYRGAWCPFCNLALATYRTELSSALEQRGIALVAISPQAPDGSLSMAEKNDLDFAVLSDSGNQIARALGIVMRPSEQARAFQLSIGLDLTSVNADGTTDLPMATTAIVTADGVLAWIDVHPDHTTRTEPRQILAALDELGI